MTAIRPQRERQMVLIGVCRVYILSGGLLMFSALFGFVHLYIRKKGLSLESESA